MGESCYLHGCPLRTRMGFHVIDLDLHLPPERVIDIVLIQWHTPAPSADHRWLPIDPEMGRAKFALLDSLQRWLVETFDTSAPRRPLLVIAPELSTPVSAAPLLSTLASSLARPTVIIA